MFEQKIYYHYILANRRNGTLYNGITNDLERRIPEHRNGTFDGFTKRYRIHMLVYYETFEDVEEAIAREKRVKKWKRAWKLRLIEKHNPKWIDLCTEAGEILSLPNP